MHASSRRPALCRRWATLMTAPENRLAGRASNNLFHLRQSGPQPPVVIYQLSRHWIGLGWLGKDQRRHHRRSSDHVPSEPAAEGVAAGAGNWHEAVTEALQLMATDRGFPNRPDSQP